MCASSKLSAAVKASACGHFMQQKMLVKTAKHWAILGISLMYLFWPSVGSESFFYCSLPIRGIFWWACTYLQAMKVFLCKNCEHERYQCFACHRLSSAKTDPPEVKALLPNIVLRNFKQTSWPLTWIIISYRYFLVLQQVVGTFIMLNVLHNCSSLKMKQKQLSTRQG